MHSLTLVHYRYVHVHNHGISKTCYNTGEVCYKRMNGFRVFVTPSEDTTDKEPVYTSRVENPGPVITIDLEWKVGR